MSVYEDKNKTPSHNNRVSITAPRHYLDPSKLDINNKEWYKLIMYSDLSCMSYQQFRMVLRIERVMTPVARDL